MLKTLWPLAVFALSIMLTQHQALANGACYEIPKSVELSSLEQQWLDTAKEGKIETLAKLTQQGVNIHVTDTMENTALHIAATTNQFSVVQELLHLGLSTSAVNAWGETPLMLAAGKGRTAIVKLLLNNQSPVNLQSCSGDALTYAISSKSLETVELLLDSGAHPNMPIRENITALMMAVDSGSNDIFERILKTSPNLIAVDAFGNRALTKAIGKDNLTFIARLLDLGADVNLRTGTHLPPLALSILRPNVDVAWKILEHFPNVKLTFDLRNISNLTSLMLAASKARSDLFAELVARGASVEDRTTFTSELPAYRPLHFAALTGDEKALITLYELGANASTLTRRNESVLWLMAKQSGFSDKAVAQTIKLAPEMVNTLDIIVNKTPLIWAATNNDLIMATELLSNAANPFIVDNEMHTAYYYAQLAGNQKMQALLKEAME